MTAVFFDTNALYVEGYRDSFAAGTLTADLTPIGVGVRVLHGTDYIVNDAWANYTRQDGSAFASQSELVSYLTREFAKRRPVGETFGISTVAGEDIAQGEPVAISRATGQLLPARADTYTLSFVAGLASANTLQGFTNQPAHGAVTLDDWTPIVGTATLIAALPYFLARAGGLTTLPDRATTALVRVGYAASPTTLIVAPTDPILL